ncbi:MAG: hypothetical protein AAGH81_02090 [Bacteroidota bacterium]
MRTILWAWFVFSVQFMAGQHIKDLSFSTETENIMHQEFIVSASIDEVWNIWTTNDGLQSWLALIVRVDWRRARPLNQVSRWAAPLEIEIRLLPKS